METQNQNQIQIKSTDTNSLNDLELEKYIFTFTIISLSFSGFFIFIINNKLTSYAKILRLVVVAEAICQFSLLIFVCESISWLFIRENSVKIFDYITFNLFFGFDLNNQGTLKMQKILMRINSAIFYSMEIFSIFLSSFICLEIILVLKNPIAPITNRLNIYFIFVQFLGILVFLLVFFYQDFDMIIINNKRDDINFLYKEIFYSNVGR
jgi:hypothetical protein